MTIAALIKDGMPVGRFPSEGAVEKFTAAIGAENAVVVTSAEDIFNAFSEPQMRRIRAACALLKDGGKATPQRVDALLEKEVDGVGKRIKDKVKASTLTWQDLITTEFGSVAATKVNTSSRVSAKSYLRAMFPKIGSKVSMQELESNPHALQRVSLMTAISDLKNVKYAGGEVVCIQRVAGTQDYERVAPAK